MEFKKEHELIRKLARDFAENELQPIASEIDETEEFPREVFLKMADCGFFGMKAPRELGGAGADLTSYAIVIEEIAKVCGVASMYISLPNSLAGMPLLLAGTPEQKKKYLPPMIKGEKITAFAITEPGAGSNTRGMLTTATRDGDDYILDGRKCFISAAPIADHAIVFAKTKHSKAAGSMTGFIVDMKLPGVSVGANENKMGMRGLPTSDIVLENVRVSKEDRLGREGDGFKVAMDTIDVGRIGAAAQALGIAQGAYEEAVKYADQRKQFGKYLSKFQSLQFMMADMKTLLHAARLMVYDAAALYDAGKPCSAEAAMAKYFAAENAKKIVDDALQIHGGYGYMKDYAVERMYRDARVISIFEGTSQVQQMVIAKHLNDK